ncbi:hypothetical protein pb186bvf_004935 [Paramecium bursaria]
MGVNDLWTLLVAAGRIIDPESLRGKRVAIDVSIWMIKILHGMSKAGVNYQNVHVIGIMKRIVYLLQMGVKPVFVFDGPAPELKKKTLVYRSQQRNRQNQNLQKVVERYIVKLIEKGVDIIEPQEQQKMIDMIEELPPSEIDDDEQEIMNEKLNESLNLQYLQLSELTKIKIPDFEKLDIQSKEEKIEEMKEQVGTSEYVEDPDIQLQRFISMAKYKERLRQIKIEASKQIELLRIEKFLEKYDDKEADLIRDYMALNDDIVAKLGNLGINNIYVYLEDKNKRQELVDKLYKNKKIEKKKKLKDYQLENQQFSRLRSTIKQRFLNRKRYEEEIKSPSKSRDSEDESIDLAEKYGTVDFDDIGNKIQEAMNFRDDNQNEQQNQEVDIAPNDIPIDQQFQQEEVQKDPEFCEKDLYKYQLKSPHRDFFYMKPVQQEQEVQEPQDIQNTDSNYDSSSDNTFQQQSENDMDQLDPITNKEYRKFLLKEKKEFERQFSLQQPPPIIKKIDSEQEMEITYDKQQLERQTQQQESNIDEIDKILTQIDDVDNGEVQEMFINIQRHENIQSLDYRDLQNRYQDIRFLLDMFGIPYLVAPGEAEAQCAYLEQQKLVDCIITEDSDVFLFGGTKVIKGIFERVSNIQYYDMEFIQKDLGLDRNKLILLALFLGSDYTMGIKGVGIVNAMEIVEAFDSKEALLRFSEWASRADLFLKDRDRHYENLPQKEIEYKLKHMNYKKSWELPMDFPSQIVIDGYLKPRIDKSEEKFTWGQPAMNKIIQYAKEQLKYSDQRIQEQIVEPLSKTIQQDDQRRITDYFKISGKLGMINSRRINNAVSNMMTKNPTRNSIQVKKLNKKPIVNPVIFKDEEVDLDDFKYEKKQQRKP